MSLDLAFAYVQARIQARVAGLPEEDEWQRLAASRSLASFLEEARAGPVRDWVKGFSGQSGVHELEAGLRTLYRDQLDEVSSWVPASWCDAVSWIRWLLLLPVLSHLAGGGRPPGWVARDPDLRPLLGSDGALDPTRLAAVGAQGLVGDDGGHIDAWLGCWRRRWPRCDRETSLRLEELTALLEDHFHSFHRNPPGSAWPLRRDLRARLRSRLHRRVLQPEVPFIYLALIALDLERLRASLVTRALFSGSGEHFRATAGQGTA